MHGPRFPNTTEPHGPHRSCDGHHIIIDYREDCDRQHSPGDGAVLNWQGELPDWGMAMSTFTNQTSRADIEARISERRRAENGNELTTPQGDYHQPFGQVEARAEAAKLCQV